MATVAGTGVGVARLSKACTECHSRKVKCDAPMVGIPCGRCVSKGTSESCKLVSRQTRKRKRRTDDSIQDCHGTQNNTESTPRESSSNRALVDSSIPSDSIVPPSSIRRTHGSHGLGEFGKTSSIGSGRTPENIRDVYALPQAQAEYNGRTHYLSILKTAMNGSETSESPGLGSTANSSTDNTPHYPENTQVGMSGLDPVDLEFLMKKGAFALPHRDALMMFLTAYFRFVHPYSPVLNPNHFLQSYESGTYSPFLIQTVLTSATLYVPADLLTSCGYSNVTEAQTAFFSKALLLHDFQCEKSQLYLLQGSLILGTTAFFYPIDRDVQYWFFNAVRLATKLELQKLDQLRIADAQLRGLYRRIWWVIYCRDVLLSFLGLQSMPLVSDKKKLPALPMAEDWEVLSDDSNALSPFTITREQELHFIDYCKLSMLGRKWLVKISEPDQVDAETMAHEFRTWGSQLRGASYADHHLTDGPYLTALLAASYRFECILYRTIKLHWKTVDTSRYDWARGRLRCSLFELDTLFGRALANGELRSLPMSFNSNIPIALALHIETALDSAESNATKSMSLIYIRQGLLILEQLQDLPVMKRISSIFEWALSRLDLIPEVSQDKQVSDGIRAGMEQDGSVDQMGASTDHEFGEMLDQVEPWFGDFLGLEFLDNLRSSGDRV
ncbi:hypothetical protein JMJ77_0008406 [Colletotrichum scovillei]|uniref:Zn(2)-C6 fungal-type domain-containing protein n=1 Tax=Colletotrichum scovillei TaxID=1209932 RepID=A0A9P7RER3_9PEZI|nr:hypothetical protein JMJ77_0008406 [Colletotrichum scovillei]KAG7075398.1 hypothetical protein JMJ76_0011858 [Colletotrichum scovillei]KAG7082511.1 hypothetical protein JMJ78_0004612 [Colletotrichum scovillei]